MSDEQLNPDVQQPDLASPLDQVQVAGDAGAVAADALADDAAVAKPARKPRGKAGAKASSGDVDTAAAAGILGIYQSEVYSVSDAPEGLVAVTTDGQRYLLTGETKGDYTWLQVASKAPQILAGE